MPRVSRVMGWTWIIWTGGRRGGAPIEHLRPSCANHSPHGSGRAVPRAPAPFPGNGATPHFPRSRGSEWQRDAIAPGVRDLGLAHVVGRGGTRVLAVEQDDVGRLAHGERADVAVAPHHLRGAQCV